MLASHRRPNAVFFHVRRFNHKMVNRRMESRAAVMHLGNALQGFMGRFPRLTDRVAVTQATDRGGENRQRDQQHRSSGEITGRLFIRL